MKIESVRTVRITLETKDEIDVLIESLNCLSMQDPNGKNGRIAKELHSGIVYEVDGL